MILSTESRFLFCYSFVISLLLMWLDFFILFFSWVYYSQLWLIQVSKHVSVNPLTLTHYHCTAFVRKARWSVLRLNHNMCCHATDKRKKHCLKGHCAVDLCGLGFSLTVPITFRHQPYTAKFTINTNIKVKEHTQQVVRLYHAADRFVQHIFNIPTS